jgi:hypothetical protein
MVVEEYLVGCDKSGKGDLILNMIFCRDMEDKPG